MAQGRQRHRLQGRQLALPARLLLIAALGWAPLCAFADASAGIRLLQENRPREAREEFEKGAANGERLSQAMLTLFLWRGFDRPPERTKACEQAAAPSLADESMAQAVLAYCHLTGTVVAQDLEKARTLARPGALGGNNEARYAYYLAVLHDPARSYMVGGKPDKGRYDALAARPAEARVTEIEAIDMLARAAQTGHRDSQIALAAYFFDTLGEGNRGKALTLYSQIPGLPEPIVRARDALTRAQRQIAGPSPLTVKLMFDAQASGVVAAAGASPPGCKDVRLASTAARGPIEEAVYLPNTHPWVERSYLVKGHWEEDWRYSACGKIVVVRMRFDADGMSGAYFRSSGPR